MIPLELLEEQYPCLQFLLFSLELASIASKNICELDGAISSSVAKTTCFALRT